MTALVLVGAQWGDEGKGKVTDFLAASASLAVRYQGGSNAGHTLQVQGETYKLHLVPSGILHKGCGCLLGNGAVVDLPALVGELTALKNRGVDTSGFYLSGRAHLILPHHKYADTHEESRKGEKKIGTTGRGIGPAYTDKFRRDGLRVVDLKNAARFRQRLKDHGQSWERHYPDSGLDWDRIADEQVQAFEYLSAHVVDGSIMVNKCLDDGGRVLFEGAQGTFLDIDHGTYPYVTSSSPIAGGACTGTGVGPSRIGHVLGVTKAYTTRVGSGPFVTELNDATGEAMVTRGHEFGTTTGRKRRCGWLDIVMLRFAVRINGMGGFALTKLDVLDGFETLKVCVAYETPEGRIQDFPDDVGVLEAATPVYEEIPGWKEDTSQVQHYEELPAAARAYVARIEELAGIPVHLVSVGAGRGQTLVRRDPWTFCAPASPPERPRNPWYGF